MQFLDLIFLSGIWLLRTRVNAIKLRDVISIRLLHFDRLSAPLDDRSSVKKVVESLAKRAYRDESHLESKL